MTRTRPAATTLAALLAGLSLSVGVAACGGEQIAADEVAAPPPELTLPTEGNEKGADALAGDASSEDADAKSTNGDEDENKSSDSSTDSTDDTSGGATAPSTGGSAPAAPQATAAPSNPGAAQAPAQQQQDNSANDTAPQPGSGAEKFEEFCQQNAGAC